jgi:polyhydroxyalkanoate synthesis regulator phasin
MNSNNIFQAVQKGFRVTVGATASVVETIQNPQKRIDAFSEIQTELSQKTEEWSKKGEETEEEARRMLDVFLRRQNWQTSNSGQSEDYSSNASNINVSENIQSEIQDLTEQIVKLRNELEELRKSE